jgi:hypothetical protein
MTISDKELAALHNLADKQAGRDVDWINIADARALTELGYARRNRGGWEITHEGLALVKKRASERTVVAMFDPPGPPAPSANESE